MFHLTLDEKARLSRHLVGRVKIEEEKPTWWQKNKLWFGYGLVALGVGTAVFVITPANAAGSQSNTPSIIYMGEKAKFQMRVDDNKAENSMRLETYKSENQLRLEDAKSLHARQLEEDRAYHKKLEWQRKNSK